MEGYTLVLGKADPTHGVVPTMSILIAAPLPSVKDLGAIQAFYDAEATGLADALATALPQGTMHALLIALLIRYANVYRGPTSAMPSEPGAVLPRTTTAIPSTPASVWCACPRTTPPHAHAPCPQCGLDVLPWPCVNHQEQGEHYG